MVLHVKHLSQYLTRNRPLLEGALLIMIVILKTLILCSQT